MLVEKVLTKIAEHNPDVLGCIAAQDERVYHTLPEPYDLIDAGAVAEKAAQVFEAADALETGHAPFDQTFLEYESHSLYARRLADGVLVLIADPIERRRFKRMQVGVNLFLKPLERALETAAANPVPGSPFTKTERVRWF